jgi:pyrroloquinoline quinone (PQQ) biosynthesis protein C
VRRIILSCGWRFAEAIGASRERVLDASPSAASASLVRAFTELAEGGHVSSGLAALYAYESQIPAVEDGDDRRAKAVLRPH